MTKEKGEASFIASIIAIAIFIALVEGAALGGLVTFAIMNDRQAKGLEAEYYRGTYDVCLAQILLRDPCLKSVDGFREDDWYGQESWGWRWPPSKAGAMAGK